MLNINSDTVKVPNKEFLSIMYQMKKVLINKEEILSKKHQLLAQLRCVDNLLHEYITYTTEGVDYSLTRNNIRKFLQEYENIPSDEFYSDKEERESFDASVLDKLIKKGYCTYFLNLYKLRLDLDKQASTCGTYVTLAQPSTFVDNYNKPLSEVYYKYSTLITNRIATSNYNLQAIPKSYKSMIKAPKDYFILSGDLKQADFRVSLQLILDDNEGIMRGLTQKYDDRYECFARALDIKENKEFDLDYFKENRNKFKTAVLGPIYGQNTAGIAQSINDYELASRIREFFNKNPKYEDYENQLKNLIKQKREFYCYSYFGYKMPVNLDARNILNASLNKPIQSTSADILKIVTCEIYNRVQSHLIDKSLFIPYLNRHDETLFLVHKSVIPYLYEFLDCIKIQIDDWALFEIEWTAGYEYGVEDKELMEEIIDLNKNHEETPRVVHKRQKPYFPCTKELNMFWKQESYLGYICDTYILGNKCFAHIHNYEMSFPEVIEKIKDVFNLNTHDFNRLWITGYFILFILKIMIPNMYQS